MKNKETLEEVAEKYATNHGMMAYVFPEKKESFIQGAKWQKEQEKNKYSEEDLVHLLNFVSKEYNISNGIGWFHTHESIEDVPSIEVLDKWFGQYKKK